MDNNKKKQLSKHGTTWCSAANCYNNKITDHRQRFFVSRKIKKGTGTVRDEILFTCNILRSFYCDLELAKLPKDALKATKKKKKTIAFSYDFFCFSWQIAGHF